MPAPSYFAALLLLCGGSIWSHGNNDIVINNRDSILGDNNIAFGDNYPIFEDNNNNDSIFSNNDTCSDNSIVLEDNNDTSSDNDSLLGRNNYNNETSRHNNSIIGDNNNSYGVNNIVLEDNNGDTCCSNYIILEDNNGTSSDNDSIIERNNDSYGDDSLIFEDNNGTSSDNDSIIGNNTDTYGNKYLIFQDYNGTNSDNYHSNSKNNLILEDNNRTSRVLNFFPIPVSVECLSDDGRRVGVCLNAYECKIQSGRSHGPCALGFGVCCIFTATCGADIINNVTYFVSPAFPALSRDAATCNVQIQKVDPSISQLRLDFVHFNLGQPNRRTGVCDSDVFLMSGGVTQDLKLCGQNSGQHVYYDVENVKDPINIIMNLTHNNLFRMWEIKITQIEFNQRAPAGCWQYYQGSNGIVQTMNFAENGRHLADQDYTICMRQEEGMCSIAYEPCDENSFKIGPPVSSDPGSGDGGLGDNRECDDKIVMPCDSEEFITPEAGGPGVCDLLHCGNSFCNQGEKPCRIESSTTPFNIRVQFGPGTREESPEDNLGMCLRYEQLPCYV